MQLLIKRRDGDCPRPREAPPTCANCGGEHPACSVRCPTFIQEARNRRAGTVAITQPRLRPDAPLQEADAPFNLMAAANGPTSTATHTAPKRRRRGNRGGKRRGKKPQEAAAAQPSTTDFAPVMTQAPARAAAATGLGSSAAAVTRTGADNTIQTTEHVPSRAPVRSTAPPQPRRQQDSAGTTPSRTACAIKILLGVIRALREGTNPEEAVLDGLTALLKDKDIDVALISETHLGPADRTRFPGYVIYRRDETSAHQARYRGLAVLVRRRVVHQELPTPHQDSIYTLGVQLHVAGEDVGLYACYKPPATRLNLAELRALLPPHAPGPVLIAGDLNCKHPAWNSTRTNGEGRRLFTDAEAHGYAVSGPEVPTHYPDARNYTPDVLDIVVHSGLHCQITQQVLDDEMQSDHHPVLVVLAGMPTRQRPAAPRHKTDWTIFQEKLEIATPTRPVVSAADVDGLAEDVTACIQGALEEATLPQTGSPQGAFAHPPLPHRLRALIAKKRRLRKRWQVTRCPTEKAVVNRLAEEIKAELRTLSSESWEAHLDAVDGDWPSIHRLCRQLSNAPAPVRPLLDSGGALRYTASDRAEIFAAHLERQFRPNDAADEEHVAAVEQHLESYFASPIASEEDPIYFSPCAVRRAILRTKLKKAPGADGITNTVLRHLPHRTVAALARLFTGILRTGTFPSSWKEGRVIMLPKAQKNVLKPESYRPITLLPTISKVFEKLLLRHLTPHLTPRPEQFGFRAEHSTTLQLSRVLHHLANTANRKEYAVAVFLDMEKAFDRVWHPGLVYKISATDTPRRITQVISSFLTGRRTYRVVVEGALSSARPVGAGVPQGSCLSPVCYSRYTDDIPSTEDSTLALYADDAAYITTVVVEGALSSARPVGAGVPQGSCLSPVCYSRYTDDIPSTEDSTLALYADDAAYITTSLSARHAIVKMQRVLDLLPEWLSKWRLSVNVGKTQALLTGRPRHPPRLQLQGASIEWSRRVKYLGVTIDWRLTMGPHARQVANHGMVARALLRPVLSSRLPLKVKLGVYKTYIRPILTYAAPAWYALTSEGSRKLLQAQQSVALRLW
uniref:Reverse transcriptase domain-containing protein n=1 Tax=Heliothis virescens TaxID=7102 RepID=A0A2A4JQF8_HELVI